MTKISVIVTSYNYEQYLRRTLDSLLNQTYKDFEVIIVDDGSKDNSVDIIKEYVNNYQNFYLYTHDNNENKGLAESVKLGISKAKGEYIAFLESDDYWTEDYLQTKFDFIKEKPNAFIIINDIKIEGNKCYELHVNGVAQYFRNRKSYKKDFSCETCNNIISTFSIVMIKTTLIKSLDFNTPVAPWLDWWLWRQAVIEYPISYIDKQLTIWNRHDCSFISEAKNIEIKPFIKKSDALLYKNYKSKYLKYKIKNIIKTFIQNIFSVTNYYSRNKTKKNKKIIILGMKMTIPVHDSNGLH